MRSVSIALLEAIDRRLCALVSRTNTSYLGASLAERDEVIKEHKRCVYELEGKTKDDVKKLQGRGGIDENGGCVVFCFSKGVGVLTVKGGDKDYLIIKCSSLASVMQLFAMGCSNTVVNKVAISDDKKTITLNGQSIEF